jgi:nitrogen fixation protein NifB
MTKTAEVFRTVDISRHPCFGARAAKRWGRIHLPVAPKCNIQCNYCDRRSDCAHESRPGVSSGIQSPDESVAWLEKVLAAGQEIAVVGIAGPGDPLANPEETFATLQRVRALHSDMLLCLATNGLALPEYVDNIAEVGASHVTVTINAIDPEIGGRMLGWVRYQGKTYRGSEAAEILLQQQLEGILGLIRHGLIVKINTVLVPGVNDNQAVEVSKYFSDVGAEIHNIIPLIPVSTTPFGSIPEPTFEEIHRVRSEAGKYLAQMSNCTRCRADACGKIPVEVGA